MFAILAPVVAISLVAATSVSSSAGPVPATTVSAESCDFGEIYSFHAAQCQISFYNAGDKPVRVFGVQPTKAGSSVAQDTIIVEPHAKAYIEAKVLVNNEVGSKRYPFRFSTDEKGQEPRLVSISGFILSALDDVRPKLDLGVVDLSSKVTSKSFSLGSQEAANFRLEKVIESPAWLDVNISADGRGLQAKVRSDAAWGLNSGFIKIKINSPRQDQTWIEVRADVHGDIVPNANPLDMGLMHLGDDNEFLVRLTSRTGEDFKIGKVDFVDAKGDVSAIPCNPVAKGCRMIRLVVSDQQKTGAVKGNISVDLPEFGRKLSITAWGLLFPKSVKLGKFDKESSAAGDEVESSSQLPVDKRPVELASELRKSTSDNSPIALLPPPGSGPLLRWQIANGSSIYGFQIFRADAESGPFLLVNPSPVRAASSEVALNYQWRDVSALPGRTYWYYVGIVKVTGDKERLTGPQKAVAK